MSKANLVASKSFRYGGRALRPGDAFEATSRDARILSAIGKAGAAPAEPAPKPDDEADALRAEYEATFGKAADKRWSVKRLRDEMDKAGSYKRRDMRAED